MDQLANRINLGVSTTPSSIQTQLNPPTMQETWTFDLPRPDFPSEELKPFLQEKLRELGIFLSYYYKSEGAVAEQVQIKGDPQFQTERAGKLLLEFDLVHFNACLAIHEQKRESMELDFDLDPEQKQLRLRGPFWPSREMDEL